MSEMKGEIRVSEGMRSKTPITDALRKMLGEVDADTGKTHWESIMDVLKTKAAEGDGQSVKLLKRAEGIQAANPAFLSDKSAAEG